ncbi:MAG: hypothetical protein KF901_35185, partial [Myxococcales bacterium]|nr:hypothetical protein [Myxococcales bacterium]
MTVPESEDETRTKPGGLPRALVVLLRLGAWLAALPYVLVVVLVLTGPPTWSAVAYLAGVGALLWGLMTLPGDANGGRALVGLPRPRGLARGAVLALLAVGIIRGCTARAGETMA